MQVNDLDRARAALRSIPPDIDRSQWVKAGMAAHAAGLTFDDFDTWSAGGSNYKAPEARATWRSFKAGKGVGVASLFGMAQDHGWKDGDKPAPVPKQTPTRPAEPPRKPAPGMSASEVWGRCEQATNAHPYIAAKQAVGVPLGGLKVLPAGDGLRIANESMAGALVVPLHHPNGSISSLQFIATPEVAARLKAQGKPGKLNLPGASMEGFHTVGEIVAGGVVHICEGLATAWACWQATGAAAVACCGWGRVRGVAANLRGRDASAKLVICPDAGKEKDAADIARELGCFVAEMPPGEASNFDCNDLKQRDGGDALAELLVFSCVN